MALIITLAVLGLLLLLAEIVILPGVGVAGIVGTLALIGSVYYAYSVYGLIGLFITLSAIAVVGTLSIFYALRSKTWNRLTLHSKINSKIDETPKEKGIFVGEEGKTLTRLAPMGKARFGDAEVEVSSQGRIIDAGVDIKVVSVEDYRIFVEEI